MFQYRKVLEMKAEGFSRCAVFEQLRDTLDRK